MNDMSAWETRNGRDSDTGLATRFRDALLLVGSVAVVGLLVGVVMSYPDLKRYLKMRSM